jgi:hypothetical protein
MNRIRVLIILSIISAFGFLAIFISSCKKKSLEGMIIFTQVSGKLKDINLAMQQTAGQKIQARIVALSVDKSGSEPDILTKGFYSARSPEISCDGTMMLFSAQQKQDDTWQIWEIDLRNLKSRQVTSLPEDCFDPAYVPNGRVIFSRQILKDNFKSGLTLVSCNPDGSDMRPVTFNPYSYSASTVLKDGRILAISRGLNSDKEEAVFMILRPDGTKNELFHKGSGGSYPGTRGWETTTGRIVFIESDKGKADCGEVISISYNRPLHTYVNLSSGTEGNFNSVFPLKSGNFLVSYRKSESEKYSLYEFDPDNKTLGQVIYESKDFDIAEVVVVAEHERSRKLPSEVDMGVKTGLLLCQDVNFYDVNASGSTKLHGVTKIRVIGRDSTLGEIDVEKDGSFYLKVIADTPFQIQTIDDKGNVVGDPCSWIYLRPNERRGCIGCHEDNELVPENKVSLAVKQAPINIPVHISKVVEKKVSLE